MNDNQKLDLRALSGRVHHVRKVVQTEHTDRPCKGQEIVHLYSVRRRLITIFETPNTAALGTGERPAVLGVTYNYNKEKASLDF